MINLKERKRQRFFVVQKMIKKGYHWTAAQLIYWVKNMERIESNKFRVILREVIVKDEGEARVRAEVSLSFNGRLEQAERIGPAGEETVLLSIAEATIDALNRLL